MNCFANVLATKRRNTVPVAMPRTPPSFFLKPVIWANMKERNMVSGTVARANSCAAAMSNNNVSLSFKQTRKISFVHPPGPDALPESALRRQAANNFESNSNKSSGTNLVTSSGITACRAWGLLRRSSSNVAALRGARDAPINS